MLSNVIGIGLRLSLIDYLFLHEYLKIGAQNIIFNIFSLIKITKILKN